MGNLTIADNLDMGQIEAYCAKRGINDDLTLDDVQTLVDNNYGIVPDAGLPTSYVRNYYIEGYDERGNKIAG